MRNALKQVDDGVIIELNISPGAKKTAIHGYNQWRKRIEIRLSEKPQKGKANAELIYFLSTLFDVQAMDIQIISGSTNSKKSVLIMHARIEDILRILSMQ